MASKSSVFSSLAIAAMFAVELTAYPVLAAPVVVNADFVNSDDGLNATYNGGNPFWLVGWNPVGYASNSAAFPGQYDTRVSSVLASAGDVASLAKVTVIAELVATNEELWIGVKG